MWCKVPSARRHGLHTDRSHRSPGGATTSAVTAASLAIGATGRCGRAALLPWLLESGLRAATATFGPSGRTDAVDTGPRASGQWQQAKSSLPKSRTCNPRLRGPMPHPLGHGCGCNRRTRRALWLAQIKNHTQRQNWATNEYELAHRHAFVGRLRLATFRLQLSSPSASNSARPLDL